MLPKPSRHFKFFKGKKSEEGLTHKDAASNEQQQSQQDKNNKVPISFAMDLESSGAIDDDDDNESLSVDSSNKMEKKLESAMLLAKIKTRRQSPPNAMMDLWDPALEPDPFHPYNLPSPISLAQNPYLKVVSELTPSEQIAKFMETANPRVQDAVRTTILGLIGSLPKMAFDTTTIITGQRLASLMFQLQMTGYMIKNADYRLSMSQSLGVANVLDNNNNNNNDNNNNSNEPQGSPPEVTGKIQVRYTTSSNEVGAPTEQQNSNENSMPIPSDLNSVNKHVEVDAAAYMEELRAQVKMLADELASKKNAMVEDSLRNDLLVYIRTLPKKELKSLTADMSQEVLVCMKALVRAVLSGLGDGKVGPDTVTEQSGEAMAQLCMWQLAIGYNLRELEELEEVNSKLGIAIGNSGFPSTWH